MVELTTIAEKFEGQIEGEGEQACVYIANDKIIEGLEYVKSQGYVMMMDITAIDELGQNTESRFVVVYALMHSGDWSRLRIKSRVAKTDMHPTSINIFKSSSFAEREIYDMYGVEFEGHDDMRRILCPDDFDGHPLRKDFPLKGKGYRSDFPNYNKDLLKAEE
jgi:NADH-quinone oxidoreductase subunit C